MSASAPPSSRSSPSDRYEPCMDRTFLVGTYSSIIRKAGELVQLILETPFSSVQQNLINTVDLLYDVATEDYDNSRTVALVADEIYQELDRLGEFDLADAFRHEMQQIAIDMYLRVWMAVCAPSVYRSEFMSPPSSSSTAEEPLQATDSDLINATAFLSDLYAVRILSQSYLKACILVIIQDFTHPQHLIFLLILLSRASSYNGRFLGVGFCLDCLAKIRRRCLEEWRIIEPGMEETLLTKFIRQLTSSNLSSSIRTETNRNRRRTTLPYFHQIEPELSCDIIFRKFSLPRDFDQSDAEEPEDDLDIEPLDLYASASSTPSSCSSGGTLAESDSDIEKGLFRLSLSTTEKSDDNCASPDSPVFPVPSFVVIHQPKPLRPFEKAIFLDA